VWIQTKRMRDAGHAGDVSAVEYCDAYWTVAQLVAHHTVNGCNLRPGDLLGTGTLSGSEPDEAGSLLELTAVARSRSRSPNGETRAFLQDGDTGHPGAFCQRDGFRRVGFGECRGTVLPARSAAQG
jgi:fumarylacetoacetase